MLQCIFVMLYNARFYSRRVIDQIDLIDYLHKFSRLKLYISILSLSGLLYLLHDRRENEASNVYENTTADVTAADGGVLIVLCVTAAETCIAFESSYHIERGEEISG